MPLPYQIFPADALTRLAVRELPVAFSYTNHGVKEAAPSPIAASIAAALEIGVDAFIRCPASCCVAVGGA